MIRRILIWDTPTRVFHWLQALSFGVAYFTSDSERYRDIHIAFGYIMLGLIVFRLLWGFIGTSYARFSSFLFKPGEIVSYLMSLFSGRPEHYLGHNPAGSIAVWLLLSLGMFLSVTGVLALQDDASDAVIEMHGLATDIMLAVVFLHLAGVFVSSILHRENLVWSMITGFKSSQSGTGVQRAFNWLGLVMLIAVVAFAFYYLRS